MGSVYQTMFVLGLKSKQCVVFILSRDLRASEYVMAMQACLAITLRYRYDTLKV